MEKRRKKMGVVQSNTPNASPDYGSIPFMVQDVLGPIL